MGIRMLSVTVGQLSNADAVGAPIESRRSWYAEMSELRIPAGQKPERLQLRAPIGNPADGRILPFVRQQQNADGDLELVEYSDGEYSVILYND